MAAYNKARENTAPYTDYIERAKADADVAETILKEAFGDDFRTKLETASKKTRDKFKPLLNLLDESQKKQDEANARLDELNGDAQTSGSIAQAQQSLDEKKHQLNDLIAQIEAQKEQGDLAIQVGGDADIQIGGSIAGSTEDPDDYVGIQVDGQLNTESDGDNRFVSPDAVNIGSAQTNKNSLDIISLGDVNVDSTDAERFSGAGENINVKLEGDSVLGDIISDDEQGKVKIDVDGDLVQEAGTAIRGNELDVKADGDVDIDLYVDEVKIKADGDVNLTSNKTSLTVGNITAGDDVTIEAAGDVLPGSGSNSGNDIVAGGDVTIRAKGNIGNLKEDLVIRTDGKVVWKTAYGIDFVKVVRSLGKDRLWDDPDHREYYVCKDDGILEMYLRPGTELEVFGYGLCNAFLWVGTAELRQSLFADAKNHIDLKVTVNGQVVFNYCVAIARIINRVLMDGKWIPVIDWDEFGRYDERMLTFRYFVGTAYNGFRYKVTVVHDDTVTEITGTVDHGYIIFDTVNEAFSITVDIVSEN